MRLSSLELTEITSVTMEALVTNELTTGNGDTEEPRNNTSDGIRSMTIVEAVLMTIILIENGLILLCFIRNKKLWRNITNYYIIQLTLSDFVTGLFTGFHIAVQLHPALLRNEYACLARYCSMMLVCSISLLSILLITYDRFVAIFKPFYYRSHASKCRVLLKCLIIDVIPIVVCLMVPLLWRKKLGKEDCLMVNIFPFEYLAFILIPMYLITIIFKFAMYGVIFHKMAKRSDRAKRMVQNRSSHSKEQLERIVRSNIALTKTGAIVLVCFTICWTPFFIHLIIQLAGIESFARANTISLATFMLILLNSALNPVIYVLRLPFFRNKLKRTLCGSSSQDRPEGSFGASLGGNQSFKSNGLSERCGIYFLQSHSVLHRGRMANRLRDYRRESGETLISYRKRSDESIASFQFLWRRASDYERRASKESDILPSLSCHTEGDFQRCSSKQGFSGVERNKGSSVETFLSTF